MEWLRGVVPGILKYRWNYKQLKGKNGVDASWYLSQYPEVGSSGLNPAVHYMRQGWKEGKDPNANFSTSWYLEEYRDVRDADLNPLLHYIKHGLREGRRPTPHSLSWSWPALARESVLLPKLGTGIDQVGTPGARKIIFTGHEASRTGAPLILLKLIEQCDSSTADEIFIFLLRSGPLLDEYRKLGHVVLLEKHPSLIKQIPALLDTLPSPGPATAICNSAECWQLIAALGKSGLKVTSLVHENLGRYPAVPVQSILDGSDDVIFPAHAMKAIAAEANAGFEQSHVIPQGLLRADFGLGDRESARRDVRRELKLPADTKLVIGCGTRELRKGFDLFHQLASKAPGAHFLWVGGNDQTPADLQKWMKHDRLTFGIKDRVSVVSSVEDPERYFLAADAFTLTSRDDPFPCVVHEAMAARLPVLAFADAGGAPEAIEGCGVTVPYLDVAEMAVELSNLLDRQDRAMELAGLAETKVRSRYKFDGYAKHILELAGRHHPAPRSFKPTMPKVFLSHRDWSISGVNTMSERLVRSLRDRGIDASLVFWEIASTQRALIPKVDHKIFGQNGLSAQDKWKGVERILVDNAPCILITNYDYTTSAVSPRLPSNIGIIGTARSDDDEHLEHATRLGRYWNRIATVSARIRERIVETDHSLANKTIYIPNFVEEMTPRSVVPSERIALFFAGRLVEHQKRAFDLARIAHGLRAQGVPFILRIAGEGHLEDALRLSLAREVEEGLVEFLGRVPHDQVARELSRHDVLLLTSSHEGMPNVVLEAMAAGCVPVVSRIQSGIPELIDDGTTGLIVDVGDIDGFVKAIDRLHRNRDELAVLSSNSVSKVREEFSPEAVVPEFEKLIREVWNEIATGAYQRPYAPKFGPYPGISVPPTLIKELHNG